MKRHLIPAIIFSVWGIVFCIYFAICGISLWAPITTGISGIIFWVLYFDDLKIQKKNDT